MSDEAQRGWVGGLMRFAGLGMQFAIMVGLLGTLGWFADRWLDTSPWLLITACLAGAALGMWDVVRTVNNDPQLGGPKRGAKSPPDDPA